MGKSQRTKGYRIERNLVLKLKAEGHLDAVRVPLSGASQFAKHDVLAAGLSIEVKGRQNSFGSVYDIHHTSGNTAVLFENMCIQITDDFSDLLETSTTFNPNPELVSMHKRAFGRMHWLRKLADGADVLAIKDDRKRYLFLRFR